MKKQVLIIGVLALFMFSCSNEEATNFEESNLKFEKKSEMTKFLKSEEFKNYLSTKNKQSNDLSKIAGNNSDNGKMILQSPWGIAFGAINFQTWEMVFIGGDGKIEKLPNGRAKFSVHTNNPWAFHSSDISLSSDCVDGPLGTFNYSLISEYTVEVIDFGGGFVFTFYTPTGENSSAESGNGHCKVSDAQPIYDYETWEMLGCSEATIYKTIKIKGNEGKGFSISLN